MPMVVIVATRRIQPYPREQFMLNTALFTIIPHVRLWGLKTPAICLLFLQVNEEDDCMLIRG